MNEAVLFCSGLSLGVVLGACLWSGAQFIARKAVTAEHRAQLASYRQQVVGQQKRLEKAKADIRMQFGDEMSKDQERIMESELGKLFTEFPNPQIRKDA